MLNVSSLFSTLRTSRPDAGLAVSVRLVFTALILPDQPPLQVFVGGLGFGVGCFLIGRSSSNCRISNAMPLFETDSTTMLAFDPFGGAVRLKMPSVSPRCRSGVADTDADLRMRFALTLLLSNLW